MSRAGLAGTVISIGSAVAITAACAGSSAHTSNSQAHNGVIISGVSHHGPWQGDPLPVPYHMPDVTLTADNGQPFNLVTDTADPVTLVFFGYTNCPDECPLVMASLAATFVRLPASVKSRTQVLFISTDPARDSDSVLRSYLARYNPDFVGLRGPLKTTMVAAQAMGVAITGIKKLKSGGYDVGHSAQVIGFRGDTAPVIWTPGTPVHDMVADITKLART
jgi:protein SCO1/2